MKRALIVKLGAIGDVVMAVPAAYRLIDEGYAVDWIAGPASASVLRCYPELQVIEADEHAIVRGTYTERFKALRAVWGKFAGRHYDCVATLYYDRRYRLLSLPVRGARHFRLIRGDRRFELLPGRHHTDEFSRILLAATGRAPDDGPVPNGLAPVFPSNLPSAPLPPPTHRRRITLAPGGARNLLRDDKLRRWQPESYVALAALLVAAGHEVVLTGGPDDVWIRTYFAGVPCTDLIGTLSLQKLMAVFHASDAVVTHDSGPLHLAGTVGCALLGLFGPVNPWGRLPRRPGAMAIWGGEGFACRPCYDGNGYAKCRDNQCMSQVTPAMALDALNDLLRQRDAGNPLPAEVRLPRTTAPLMPAAQLTGGPK